eukprot:scaffold185508_cov26-Tisochrysis_lutea.AAC.1
MEAATGRSKAGTWQRHAHCMRGDCGQGLLPTGSIAAQTVFTPACTGAQKLQTLYLLRMVPASSSRDAGPKGIQPMERAP